MLSFLFWLATTPVIVIAICLLWLWLLSMLAKVMVAK